MMEEATNRKILNGWKQISHHLDRGVRTAQRWEVLLGMPIHRPARKDRSAVVAFSDELESWLCRTPSDARDQCAPSNNKEESNERLLWALDNVSTLVQQSSELLSQVGMLQEQLRRARKSRRIASRTRLRAASTLRRGVGLALPFPRRKHSLPTANPLFAAMVDAPGAR